MMAHMFGSRGVKIRWGKFLACWVLAVGLILVTQMGHPIGISPAAAIEPAQDLKSIPVSSQPIKVSIGLHVTNLADINQASESFDVAGYLLYTWQDARLAYKPGIKTPPSKTTTLDQIWHPAIEMVNFKESKTADTTAEIMPDGTVLAQERFAKTLSSGLELQNFPFDAQSLQIVLESLKYGDKQVQFLADPSKISIGTDRFVSLSEWQIGKIIGINSKSFFPPEQQDYSRVTIEIHIKRNSGFYLLKVMMPLLLITIASWSVFWINPEEFSTQIGIAFTNLLTVVALLLVINDALPRVGYLTFMDGFTMLCFMTILVAILELLLAHRWQTREHPQRAVNIHRQARWIVPVGFTLVNLMLMMIMHVI
jgi:hypothetical protein